MTAALAAPYLTGPLWSDDLGCQAEFRAAVEPFGHLFGLIGYTRTDVGNAKPIAGSQVVERHQGMRRPGAVEEDIGMVWYVPQNLWRNDFTGRDDEIRFGDRAGRSP